MALRGGPAYVRWLVVATIAVAVGAPLYAAFVYEPRRDQRLEAQLTAIREAATVDDLKPVLEQIVRHNRGSYR